MPTSSKLTLRELTSQERDHLEQLAHSRTAAAWLVSAPGSSWPPSRDVALPPLPTNFTSAGPLSTPGSIASTNRASPASRTSPARAVRRPTRPTTGPRSPLPP